MIISDKVNTPLSQLSDKPGVLAQGRNLPTISCAIQSSTCTTVQMKFDALAHASNVLDMRQLQDEYIADVADVQSYL